MNYGIMMAFALVSPLALLWGWVKFLKIPTRTDWRSRASLVGISAPLLSIALWAFALLLARSMSWDTANSTIQHLTTIGVWIPVIGTRNRYCRSASSAPRYHSRFFRCSVFLVYNDFALVPVPRCAVSALPGTCRVIAKWASINLQSGRYAYPCWKLSNCDCKRSSVAEFPRLSQSIW